MNEYNTARDSDTYGARDRDRSEGSRNKERRKVRTWATQRARTRIETEAKRGAEIRYEKKNITEINTGRQIEERSLAETGSKEWEYERSRDNGKSRGREGENDGEIEKERNMVRDHNLVKEHDHDRRKTCDRESEKERRKEKDPEKGKDKNREKEKDHDSNEGQEKRIKIDKRKG